MLEIAQNFEQMSVRLSPIVLIVPGLTAVIVGLFVWLAGLRFRRVIVAVLGAFSGSICGLFIIGRNVMAAAALAVVAALIAATLHRVFIAILAACLAAALGFAVGYLVKPYVGISEETIPTNPSRLPVRGPALSVDESVHLMKGYLIDVGDKIRQACSQMPLYNWAIIVVLVVIFISGEFYFWRLTTALYCATLGTLLVFTGMILLLLYKGAEPISSISRGTLFYLGVFVAMIVFGTIEQLLLCPRLESRAIRRKEAKKDKERGGKATPHWRTT
ncbi:MAG: hypothetical protein ACYS30_06725 [Planctomycetota bacterium]|jgi:hypothetical protein